MQRTSVQQALGAVFLNMDGHGTCPLPRHWSEIDGIDPEIRQSLDCCRSKKDGQRKALRGRGDDGLDLDTKMIHCNGDVSIAIDEKRERRASSLIASSVAFLVSTTTLFQSISL